MVQVIFMYAFLLTTAYRTKKVVIKIRMSEEYVAIKGYVYHASVCHEYAYSYR